MYSTDCLSRAQVFAWYAHFKDGKEDLNDDSRPDRPAIVATDELVEKVWLRGVVAYDSNVTCRMLAEEFNMSKNIIHNQISSAGQLVPFTRQCTSTQDRRCL